jgi:DNA-binding IclR family transcriptional regulator
MSTEKKTRKDRILAVLPDRDLPGLGRNEIAALTNLDRADVGALLRTMAVEGTVSNGGTINRGSWTKTEDTK